MKTEEIDKGSNQHGWIARSECEERCKMAQERYPDFFQNPDHVQKIEQVVDIVKDFFPQNKGIYVNSRVGTTKTGPFTAVKINKPIFPNSLTMSQKQDKFYNPLEKLGVEIVFNRATNSYLFHIS